LHTAYKNLHAGLIAVNELCKNVIGFALLPEQGHNGRCKVRLQIKDLMQLED
jgi:hypothetical protein